MRRGEPGQTVHSVKKEEEEGKRKIEAKKREKSERSWPSSLLGQQQQRKRREEEKKRKKKKKKRRERKIDSRMVGWIRIGKSGKSLDEWNFPGSSSTHFPWDDAKTKIELLQD